jgi:hypothetical protein
VAGPRFPENQANRQAKTPIFARGEGLCRA